MPAIPSIDELLGTEVSDVFTGEPVPVGPHDAILTGLEVRKGPKGPYLNVEATIYGGDYDRRKVWGISSFSEKALGMPGGIANLVQVVNPDVDRETKSSEIPAALAAACLSAPVVIVVEHEQAQDGQGNKKYNADETPQMKARIVQYEEPSEEFIAAFEVEASGGDDDLPF